MELNRYQELAKRTMNPKLTGYETEMHALHGMASEMGEVHSVYQKAFQGHAFSEKDVADELGDLLWFIAEWCTVRGYKLEEIAQHNIDKLKKRYPVRFSEELSVNREEYCINAYHGGDL